MYVCTYYRYTLPEYIHTFVLQAVSSVRNMYVFMYIIYVFNHLCTYVLCFTNTELANMFDVCVTLRLQLCASFFSQLPSNHR